MPNPVQRSACDRCHGQKLRCTRSGHGGACVRCTKVKAVCIWTPSTRRQSEHLRSTALNRQDPSIVTPDSSPPQEDDNGMETTTPLNTSFPVVQADFDFGGFGTCLLQGSSTTATWSGPTFADATSGSSSTCALSAASPASTSYLQSGDTMNSWQSQFNQEWAMLSAEQPILPDDGNVRTRQETPTAKPHEIQNLPLATIRGLSDLNVELFTLSSTIPKPPTSLSQPFSWRDKDFAIDKTFQLSQRLIEVLDKLYPRHSEALCKNHVMSPLQEDALPGLILNESPSFDQSSFLLVLSCYQRLIETYDDIFRNMQACLDRSSITAREDYVQMPDMKVGSFSLPDSSTLQITLILQLTRHLLRRMSAIIKSLNTNYGGGTNDLMSLTFKAVNTREEDLIKRINKLRNSLLLLDIL
ncbi:hypothetical protein TruAng_006083 [Truncatella angustata]|nr:hypothetical protein TruAng_006083 [Truncatella angustata]